jgi:hypothetical protein
MGRQFTFLSSEGPSLPAMVITSPRRIAAPGWGWHLYETATVLATAHQGGTVRRAEVDIASKSQRGETKTTLAQIH